MEKIFEAIKSGNFEEVKKIIEANPSLVNCVCTNGTKKDDGQSPLQVALKNGQFDIQNYLLDMGADVNFIEEESVNSWKAPVIHDAIRAAIFCTRFNVNRNGVVEVLNTQNKADKAFAILEKMIKLGANVEACDSYGNSCLERFATDCRQVMPYYDKEKDQFSDDRIITDEFKEDISRIAKLLIDNGADINKVFPNVGRSFKEEANGIFKCLNLL